MTPPLPRHAYLAGKGRVRVLSYDGNGYFTVLTNRDDRVFVHRDRLKFTGRTLPATTPPVSVEAANGAADQGGDATCV